ncbi:angiopoietin-related protein 7-like [Saccostrea cucullata]|uniref:angiopoietin-related protein 7-like n=1 Tax=Saccostrea cuccullata TaxID=36930 RepID=UPI002ED22019
MELRKLIYLITFVYGTLGISTESDKSVVDKTDLMPSATSGKTSSVLREILNQESLVRFSMVQKIQKLVMDVIDNTDTAQNVKKRLQEAIKDLQSLENREQDSEIKNANLGQELNALNEAVKINKNMSTEEAAHTNLLITEMQSTLDDYGTRLKVIGGSLERLFVSVNETLVDTKENQKIFNMQLKDILNNQKNYSMQLKDIYEKQKNYSMQLEDISKKEKNHSTQLRDMHDIREIQMNLSTQIRDIGKVQKNHSLQLSDITSSIWSVLYPVDCLEIMVQGKKTSGIYKIYPWNNSTYKEVFCDMDTMGGGWTVFQKRMDGSVSFSRNWAEYQQGFGNASTEYWLGNDAIHALTVNSSSLYVKLQHKNGRHYFQYYSDFRISGADDDYRLHLGSYSNGTAGDMLISPQNNQTFKTPDHSTHGSPGCFSLYTEGGWWFRDCHNAYLNGVYGSRDWRNPWARVIVYGTEFGSSQMMTRRHK